MDAPMFHEQVKAFLAQQNFASAAPGQPGFAASTEKDGSCIVWYSDGYTDQKDTEDAALRSWYAPLVARYGDTRVSATKLHHQFAWRIAPEEEN